MLEHPQCSKSSMLGYEREDRGLGIHTAWHKNFRHQGNFLPWCFISINNFIWHEWLKREKGALNPCAVAWPERRVWFFSTVAQKVACCSLTQKSSIEWDKTFWSIVVRCTPQLPYSPIWYIHPNLNPINNHQEYKVLRGPHLQLFNHTKQPNRKYKIKFGMSNK